MEKKRNDPAQNQRGPWNFKDRSRRRQLRGALRAEPGGFVGPVPRAFEQRAEVFLWVRKGCYWYLEAKGENEWFEDQSELLEGRPPPNFSFQLHCLRS